MSSKILQFIVIFLGVLILICFLALIYGFYIKIVKKQSNFETKDITYDLNLEDGHKITDIDLINDNKVLFTIKNDNNIYAVIYDINSKRVKHIVQE
tara:strand:+ start:32 stop:319 length:288 start_codon:yes stop_codon:yes gene_type:complete